MCVVDFSLLEFLWEQFFYVVCLLGIRPITSQDGGPVLAGLVAFSWSRPPIISVDSHSPLTPINTPNEIRRDEIGRDSHLQWTGPLQAVVEQVSVYGPLSWDLSIYQSPGSALSSACPLVFSLSPSFKHVPQAFVEHSSRSKKGWISHFHLQHTNFTGNVYASKERP